MKTEGEGCIGGEQSKDPSDGKDAHRLVQKKEEEEKRKRTKKETFPNDHLLHSQDCWFTFLARYFT